MIVQKAKLQKIVREEIVKTLLEGNEKDVQAFLEGRIDEAEFLKRLGRKAVPWLTAAAIGAGSIAGPSTARAEPPAPAAASVEASQNMQLFLDKYPAASNERMKDVLNRLVQAKSALASKQVGDTYASSQNFDSFSRFIRSIEGYENEDVETLKANWQAYSRDLQQRISNVEVIAYYDDIDSVPNSYIQRDIPAFYDSVEKKIFVNPFFYYTSGGFSHTDFNEDLKEEYIHAAQFAAKEMRRVPIAQMQTRSALDMGIFLSQAEAGIGQEAYQYLTSPQEFHAKMFKLKSNLAKQSPESFDESGQIKKNVLLRLMNSDNAPEVLKVLDPSKIDKVLEFFNMVAQTDLQKTSQMA